MPQISDIVENKWKSLSRNHSVVSAERTGEHSSIASSVASISWSVAPISLSLDSTESGVTSNKWSVNSNHRKVLSYHKDPRFIILSAIDNVKPLLEVRKIRIAGRTRFVPGTVKTLRQQSLAVRWVLSAARQKKKVVKNSFAECLAHSIYSAFIKKGDALKKKIDLHKLAEANRTFLRYRWW